MADQDDQGTNPPAEDPTFLPLKKRAMAEKSLPGSSRAPESDSSDSSNDEEDLMDLSGNESMQPEHDLQELQEKAYYSVLRAFKTDSSTISEKGIQILEVLMEEWNISEETHVSLADKIEKDLVIEEEKEMQMAQEEQPLTEPATSNSPIVPESRARWGRFNPETLIGKHVSIRTTDDGMFEEFFIKAYDAEQDKHRIETPNSDPMEADDPLGLIDLREIPPKDIMWESGDKPDFDGPSPNVDAPKQSTRRTLFSDSN